MRNQAQSPTLPAEPQAPASVEYRNPWHKPGQFGSENGPEFFRTTARPIAYRGHLIYHRIKSSSEGGNCWDVVKDGVCVAQRAGLGGAKRYLDELA